jgi:hypothetical protein
MRRRRNTRYAVVAAAETRQAPRLTGAIELAVAVPQGNPDRHIHAERAFERPRSADVPEDWFGDVCR